MSDGTFYKNNGWTWKTTVIVSILFFSLIALVNYFSDGTFPFQLKGEWWTYVFFIPAATSLGYAWRLASEGKGASPRAIGATIGGVCILLLIPVFLLDIAWADAWPLFIIVSAVAVGIFALTSVARNMFVK